MYQIKDENQTRPGKGMQQQNQELTPDDLVVADLAATIGFQFSRRCSRRTIGPRIGETGPQPGHGTEVYLRLPIHSYIPELSLTSLLLSRYPGQIYQIRVQLTFQGRCRGSGYVRFYTKETARACVATLNGVSLLFRVVSDGLFFDRYLKINVSMSADNRMLMLLHLPEDITDATLSSALAARFPRAELRLLSRCYACNMIYAVIGFCTHHDAALARISVMRNSFVCGSHAFGVLEWASVDPRNAGCVVHHCIER